MHPSRAPQKLLFTTTSDTAPQGPSADEGSPLTGSRKGLKSPIAWYGGKASCYRYTIPQWRDQLFKGYPSR